MIVLGEIRPRRTVIFKLPPIYFIDRATGETEQEEVYGEWALALLYGPLGGLLRPLVKLPLLSRFYGWLQDRSGSRKKVAPFVKKYGLDAREFAKPVDEFLSFNDFFTRRLTPESRPLGLADILMPADGRYRFFPNVDEVNGFSVKGKTFSLEELLQDPEVTEEFRGASMAIARLCPTDYHRFHFPVDCQPGPSKLINGPLASVNPIALAHSARILSENRRVLCRLTPDLLMIEVGATNVGSISQTYPLGERVKKGDEKGFFAFGGSAILLLFRRGTMRLDRDLQEAATKGLEIKCLMGENLGKQLEGNQAFDTKGA